MEKNLSNWAHLASAAFDCRNELRALIPPLLDLAIAAGALDTESLLRLRALAVHHAEALRAALKAPSGTRRRNADSRGAGGPWGALPALGERTHPEGGAGLQPFSACQK